ncbi:MAG: 3-dehydroquinate synthase [Bacteroidales bacterium]
MDIVKIKGDRSESQILIGESYRNIEKYLPHSNVFIITDSNLMQLYGEEMPEHPIFSIEPGEQSKSLEVVSQICSWLLTNGADRKSFVLGFGGGVVCDIAGFVASVYMRGVEFGFVSTSLLSQIDASVGGKNGVDLDGYKNIIGTFNQPKFVLCDTEMLRTLPAIELSNGLAEMVKHALIANKEKFEIMENSVSELLAYNENILESLISQSVRIKADIVAADERESGERKKLNLGHTWGHAVEKVTGLPHGQSVSIGLEFAALLSVSKGLLKNDDYLRIMNLLTSLQLPINAEVSPLLIFQVLVKDKKRVSESIDFVLLNGIGSVTVERLAIKEIEEFYKSVYA